MSNKTRNRQPVPVSIPNQGAQQGANQEQEQQDDAQSQQGQEDQAQDQSSQETRQEQASQQEETATPPVQEKPVEQPAAPALKTTQEGFTPVYKVQLDLANYAEAMDKKKSIVPEEGGKWQYSLYTTIKNVLSTKEQDTFNKEWNTALVFFNQNKAGIFNENFLFRFPEQWPGSATEFTSFRRIAYLMLQTADAKTRRKALQEINMELVVSGLNQEQRTRLLNFYEV